MSVFKQRDVASRREHQKYTRHCAKDHHNNRNGHIQRKHARAAEAARAKAAWDEMANPTVAQQRLASHVKSCFAELHDDAQELQYVYVLFGGVVYSSTVYFTDGFDLYSYRCACEHCSKKGHGGKRCVTLNLPSNSRVAKNSFFMLGDATLNNITNHQSCDRLKFAYWLSRNLYFD
jgi:hypothetical protein